MNIGYVIIKPLYRTVVLHLISLFYLILVTMTTAGVNAVLSSSPSIEKSIPSITCKRKKSKNYSVHKKSRMTTENELNQEEHKVYENHDKKYDHEQKKNPQKNIFINNIY